MPFFWQGMASRGAAAWAPWHAYVGRMASVAASQYLYVSARICPPPINTAAVPVTTPPHTHTAPPALLQSPSGFDKTGPYRARFVLEALADLRQRLHAAGSGLIVRVGRPEEVLPALAKQVTPIVVGGPPGEPVAALAAG